MTRVSRCLWTLLLLAAAQSNSWSQDDGAFQPTKTDADSSVVLDQDTDPKSTESLPTSPPDGASIDPLPESRSLFLAGITVSQSVEASAGDNESNSLQASSTTRAVGTLNLLKIGHRTETAVDYRGGGYFSVGEGSVGHGQLQQLLAEERVIWQKAALTLSDSLGNLPGGNFGSAWWGGAAAYNLGTTNVGGGLAPDPAMAQFIGSSGFSGFGQRTLYNLSLAELTDSLTQRSSITVGGAFETNRYWGNSPVVINGEQISGLFDYGYLVTPRSQVGVVFGYRTFHFPEQNTGNIDSTVAQLDYGRVLSRRWQMQVGAGPEFSRIVTPITVPVIDVTVNYITNQINVSAFASLAYRLHAASMTLSYDRLVTNGSGLFAGANTNIVDFSFSRRLMSSWQGTFNAGYLDLSRINESLSLVPGNSYQYGYVGAAVTHRFGRFNVFVSYQFNDESLNTYFCQANQTCDHLVQRHVLLLGIHWHTHPIHLDKGGSQAGETDNDGSGDSNPPLSDH